MSIFTRISGLALLLAVLCPAGQAAHGQANAVPYWMANLPIGFGGTLNSDENPNGNEGSSRYNFQNGLFVGGRSGSSALGMYGINQGAAFGSSFSYEGMKFGYDFKNTPLTVYGAIDTFKYNSGPGPSSPFAAFESTSGTAPGYRAQAGIEFRPASNLSLSLGVGYTDMSSTRVDSDVRSPLLPGQTPQFTGGRRY